ncbi:SE1561 family protein [Bacillus sp. FJAT-45350]|uniref:SE1561 family protein n=1 Tax=Bacillus sp. FJAT-45350 TaxID=2011014 RepID=UPI000BB93C50|nr:SE1561 family protein [Bacillus sp. FJAT-45350]
MGKPIHNKDDQIKYLNTRLKMLGDVLDAIDPEVVELEDIDRMIEMLDELEGKCKEFEGRKSE